MDQITFDLNINVDEGSLKKVYNLGICLTEFENALKEYNMDDVFQVPTIIDFSEAEDIWIPGVGTQSIDLFKQYNMVILKL
jgi:hypothetical protein